MNDHIVIDPAIQHGKPVIRGTRVPVVRILGGLAGEISIEDLYQAAVYSAWLASEQSRQYPS